MVRSTPFFLALVSMGMLGVSVRGAEYSITDLGTLGGTMSQPTGINASGEVVGFSVVSTGIVHGFEYSGGVMRDVGTLGGSQAYALGVNDSGAVVGYSGAAPSGFDHAFLSGASGIQDIHSSVQVFPSPFSLSYGSSATAINNAGQIAGYSQFSGGFTRAFLYSGGTPQDLGTLPGGTGAQAWALSNNGEVVGDSGTAAGPLHAFLYSHGSMQDLGTLGGAYSGASAINENGEVVGDAQLASGADHAFLYANGSMHDLGSLPGFAFSIARAINSSGEIVGAADQEYPDMSSAAFLYSGGVMEDLNAVIPADSGWTLEDAMGINDSGQVAAWGVNASGQEHAILLTPTGEVSSALGAVPEPGTVLLLGIGGVMFLGRRRSAG